MLQRVEIEKFNLNALIAFFGVTTKALTDKMANFGLGNTSQLVTVAANALGLIHTGLYLRRTYQSMDEGALQQISREHESAVNSYREAQRLAREGSTPAAIALLDNAIREFSFTAPRTRNYQALNSQNLFFANLHFFKAILLFTQKKYAAAIESAKIALTFNKEQPLACNLLAFIHLYHMRDENAARECLVESLNLNPTQVFANFYLAHLDKDAIKSNEAFALLQKTFELKESKHPEIADKIPEVLNLTATTLPDFIPYLAIEWLGRHTEIENDRRELARIATIFNIVIANCQTLALEHCRALLLEKRINVLAKIARLSGSAFEDFDMAWRNAHGKPFHHGDKKLYFFQYGAAEIDHYFLKLMALGGTDAQHLLSPSLRADFVRYVIAWGKLGRFSGINHSGIHQLNKLIKKLNKKEDKKALEEKILSLCNSPVILEFFLEEYLSGKGWEPWFKILRVTDEQGVEAGHSLIQPLCRDRHVPINYFQLNAEGKLVNEAFQDKKGFLNLCAADNNEFSILQPLDSPGGVYQLLAKQDCMALLTIDPDNAVAQHFLSLWRLGSFPASAEKSLMANPRQAGLQLRLFTQFHGIKYNRCIYEDTAALFMLAVTHTHLHAVENFDLKDGLRRIINSKLQPYVDFAQVLRARLELRHVDLGAMEEAKKLFVSDADLSQPAAKNLHLLLQAELYLHGFNRAGLLILPDRGKVYTAILQFLRNEEIHTENITPELLKHHFNKVKNTFLKRYCLGYAASLLAATSESSEFNRYLDLAKTCGFCPSTTTNLEMISRVILGLPTCVPIDMQEHADRQDEYVLRRYFDKLGKVYHASTLIMPAEAYVNYALVSSKLAPKWHLPSHNWVYNDVPEEEAWLHLRDSINQNHSLLLLYLLVKVEANGGKPPFNLSEIKLDNLTDSRRPQIANWLVHLLAKSDIKLADYDSSKVYNEDTFKQLEAFYHYEVKSSCTLS